MNRVMICPRCWGRKDPYCDKCKNTGMLYDTKLSKNFSLSEFTFSPTAWREQIQNDPSSFQVYSLVELSRNLLQPMRDALGVITVNSGYRSSALNAAVRGAKNSAHLYGYAADCDFEYCKLLDAMHWLWKSTLNFDQVILEHGRREESDNDDWLHIGWKKASGVQRRQFLVMKDGKYSPWSP